MKKSIKLLGTTFAEGLRVALRKTLKMSYVAASGTMPYYQWVNGEWVNSEWIGLNYNAVYRKKVKDNDKKLYLQLLD